MRWPEVAAALPVEAVETRGDPGAFASCPLIACVPAHDEENWIGRCLAALDAELQPGDGVVLLANGCTDETVAVARGVTEGWTRPFLLVECRWRLGEGSAPFARRLALDIAHGLAPEAVLFSVDGDTVVLPGLRNAYEAEFARGFDLVCGRIGFLPEEAARLPPADPDGEAVIREYRETSRLIAALIQPDPDNPWPHHGNIGGANFAMRGMAYRIAGPLPVPPFGEDRALRRRFEAHGLRIRYSDAPRVETSPRLEGRARGGLSDELRRNRTESDPVVDELLEPPEVLLLRIRARASFLKGADAATRRVALGPLGLSGAHLERLAAAGGGHAWTEAEEVSSVLKRERLRLSDLRRHLPALRQALASIR